MVKDSFNGSWIQAQWDAPAWIKAGISSRHGGHSQAPYEGLNIASHVGDNPQTVELNRHYLKNLLELPSEPMWLNQFHGKHIIAAGKSENRDADGSYTDRPDLVCAIMTADCVPLLMCNKKGTKVAAIHVGWRGYCAGIVSKAVGILNDKSTEVLVWIGPHISEKHYEVGEDVYQGCIERHQNIDKCFTKSPTGRWYANLDMMVRHELQVNNVNSIISANMCTYNQESDFFSYRRDKITGRMASMIWIDSGP